MVVAFLIIQWWVSGGFLVAFLLWYFYKVVGLVALVVAFLINRGGGFLVALHKAKREGLGV